MANKIILSADSTCDLSPELKERYQVPVSYTHLDVYKRQFSICACGARTLTLVYRERLLKQQLRRPDVQDCLIRFGYPVTEGMDAMLAWLQRRARLEKGFPHEIGCFLGYPMEDVTGFIREKGRNCKCCGMWKVYGDEAYAKHLFEKYEQCSRALCNHLEQGVPFLHILAALPAA